MATGALDANGIWQYGEDDPISPWSTFMNKLAGSVSNVLGGAWTAYTPTLGGLTIGNGTTAAAYKRIGKTLDVNINITMGSTTAYSGDFSISLPAGMTTVPRRQVLAAWLFDTSAGFDYLSNARIGPSTTAINLALNASFVAGTTRPFTWASGDTITISGRLELV